MWYKLSSRMRLGKQRAGSVPQTKTICGFLAFFCVICYNKTETIEEELAE